MSSPAPHPLPENEGLAFVGERIPETAHLTPAAAKKLLAARNPNGRSNADVIRQTTGWNHGHLRASWLIDFPPHMDAQEAALYVEPFRRRTQPAKQNRELRNALTRRERYLAAPASETRPHWGWLDATIIPDDTLVAIARDDDFTHGIVSARPFQLWWRKYGRDPTLAIASYPFPWSPMKGLSDLTSTQEEQRHAIARAIRSDNCETLESAVAAAYAWPEDLTDDGLLPRLTELNRARTHSR